MKKCSKCKVEKDIEKFSVTKRNSDGSVKYRQSWCSPCRIEANRARIGAKKRPKPKVYSDSKECLSCHEVKPFNQFSPSKKNVNRGNTTSYCVSCSKELYYDKEKARIYTLDYRERRRCTFLASHRLHQFKRRTGIKASDDGTLGPVELKAIYEKENCYWCKKFVEKSDRTLEHIKELCEGGAHSIHNTTMACRSCNSSRKGRSKS